MAGWFDVSSERHSADSVFTVGRWTVEPDRLRISDGDEGVLLQPRVMGVLQHLAARPGQVISHDALIEAVWEGRVVEDGAVYQTLAKLRKKLGDDARHPRYIETIPKKGYCLIAPVGPARLPESPVDAGIRQKGLVRRRVWGVIVALVLIAGITATLVTWLTRS